MARAIDAKATLEVGGTRYHYFRLDAVKDGHVARLPYSLKILLENLLRHHADGEVGDADISALANWDPKAEPRHEIAFTPARVILQDFTGVPAVVDLAAMRDAIVELGGDPESINPLSPAELVIDHSVQVDFYGSKDALSRNIAREFERNTERYSFLRWGQNAFRNFRVVPPNTGIVHQVNIEHLARVVFDVERDGEHFAYPDTLVGTDSHTTMVNGLGVLGWGVGGIEAEAAMLGQPQSMLLPEVIGFKLTGKPRDGITATDIVLTVTQMLRKKGVVGKFVEFFGPGLDHMSLADCATIANMAPEYGATCGFFPVDKETLRYLTMTGRKPARVALVEKYAKTQGLFRTTRAEEPVFTDTLELDLGDVVPSLAGPKRPEHRVALENVAENFADALANEYKKTADATRRYKVEGEKYDLGHGDVAIAAITSCTNTSNPSVLIAAGLVARNAVKLGLKSKPWVKTSLAPGSQVVADYLKNSGLQKDLNKLGFNIVGFGCTTCIGNSGPLPPAISKTINDKGLIAASVLSGNRNFEGRVSPDVQANYLASPPLVVIHALAGTVTRDLTREPVGEDRNGNPVYLKDLWPSAKEVQSFIDKYVTKKLFKEKYADVFKGDANWRKVNVPAGETYAWDGKSTYVQNPPYFEGMTMQAGGISDIRGARVLGLFGDKITTDHISPAGSIKAASPAGQYLTDHGVKVVDFNQYGTRRGNHEVMMRGTFANIRIRNHMLGPNGQEGGFTIHYPSKKEMSIFDAAMQYRKEGVPLVIFAGGEYGNGSSRDWAAKGTNLLGVRAVIAPSFERIHRSNLVGMGVVPFVLDEGTTWQSLGLTGDETVTIEGIENVKPRQRLEAVVTFADGKVKKVPVTCRIDTAEEIGYVNNGGILHYVLRNLNRAA
ncbi:MAG: aconitate hydratase AcnA [Phyllobacteriaceae bacterium]|nr:aconitate hydratase AcnA [Phyllobacteriaceae bacterium]